MTYRFLSPAHDDLAKATDYYQSASPGLGLEFLEEVERTINRILLNPEAWAPVSQEHRRCRMRRFPFGLLYTIEREVVIITAVMDLRRDPSRYKERS